MTQKNGSDNCDNCDDDHEFDERKTTTIRVAANNIGGPPFGRLSPSQAIGVVLSIQWGLALPAFVSSVTDNRLSIGRDVREDLDSCLEIWPAAGGCGCKERS